MEPGSPAEGRSLLGGRTVLIADDDPTILRFLTARCRQLGLRVDTASDGFETLLRVAKERPDLLILDLNLPDVSGFSLCERLAADLSLPPLPVIILTAQSDRVAIKRCEDLGTFYIHKGPHAWEEIEFRIARIFQQGGQPNQRRAKQGPLVLLVDDDPVVGKMLATALGSVNIESMVAYNGMQGLWLALTKQPDIVITDYHMPMGSGRYLLQRIKNTPSTQHIPVILFTGRTLSERERKLFEQDLKGQAAGFLVKPFGLDALLQELRRHVVLPDLKLPTGTSARPVSLL
jgi:CheY-like chemotaxis protein